jgi:ABC-type multidrug transport system fused ATPase/permease subunit
MKHDHFWHYAKRMLRRRRLAAGTVVFSIVSAGGLATGLVASGEVLRLILATDPTSSLRSVVEAQVAKGGWIATVVPASLVEMLPTDRLAGVALILAGLCVLTVFGAVANFLHQYCSLTLSMVTIAELRLEAFRHALRLPLGTVLRRGPTEIVSRITRDCAELERGFSALTSKALAQVTKGAAAFAAAVWFDGGSRSPPSWWRRSS